MTNIYAYLLIINIFAFILYGIDKYKAKKHLWRIPEIWLLGVSVVGGSIGALTGMYTFHHKTKHLKFKFGIPVIILLQLSMVVLMFDRF